MFGQDQDPGTGRNTQFKKGQSGNPKGRPKSYKYLFDEVITDDDRRAMIMVLKEKALKGDIKAFQVIMDRTDGKPTQAVKMNQSQPLMPITILNPLRDEEERKIKRCDIES